MSNFWDTAFKFANWLIKDLTGQKDMKQQQIQDNLDTPVAPPPEGAKPAKPVKPVTQETETKVKIYNMQAAIDKAFAITGAFEGKGFTQVTGNFDGQGLSFGFLQWCLGQGSLQPLLKKAFNEMPEYVKAALGEKHDELKSVIFGSTLEAQVRWADNISLPSNKSRVASDWRIPLERLGEVTRQIQIDAAQHQINLAYSYCRKYHLRSERAFAFMFDICVQNGSIQNNVLESTLIRLNNEAHHTEKSKMLVILQERLSKVKPQWRNDVQDRKECIIHGSGFVHSTRFDLDRDFGLSDEPFYDEVEFI